MLSINEVYISCVLHGFYNGILLLNRSALKMETNHPVSSARGIDAVENIKHDRSASQGALINNIR